MIFCGLKATIYSRYQNSIFTLGITAINCGLQAKQSTASKKTNATKLETVLSSQPPSIDFQDVYNWIFKINGIGFNFRQKWHKSNNEKSKSKFE